MDDLKNAVSDCVFCKIFNKEIDFGFCWEISNIGDDYVTMPDDGSPFPYSWEYANEKCKSCPIYEQM